MRNSEEKILGIRRLPDWVAMPERLSPRSEVR
jgi:hypothetical protein